MHSVDTFKMAQAILNFIFSLKPTDGCPFDSEVVAIAKKIYIEQIEETKERNAPKEIT